MMNDQPPSKFPSLSQVRTLVRQRYLVEGNIQQQPCDYGRSFHIQANDGNNYLLKVSSANEAEGLIDLRIKALQHLSDRSISLHIPQIIADKDGKAFGWYIGQEDIRHGIYLLGFLKDGLNSSEIVSPFVSINVASPPPYSIGQFAGQLASSFRNFFHPSASVDTPWHRPDMITKWQSDISVLPNSEVRDLFATILDRAIFYTLPQLQQTRWQIVHQGIQPEKLLLSAGLSPILIGVTNVDSIGFNTVLAGIIGGISLRESDGDPLHQLCEVAAGFDSVFPLEEQEVDLLYDFLLLNLVRNCTVCHQMKGQPSYFHGSDLFLLAQPIQRLHQQGREESIRRLRRACRFPVYAPTGKNDDVFASDRGQLYKKREKHLGKIWHFYAKAIHFTRGQSAWLYTADGTPYLDTYNNVPQVGHSHPHVVRAIARQAAALNTNTRYICDITAEYAERLTATLPDHLNACIFVNSGSEANDLAMQIAMALSGRKGSLVMENAYHGCTALTTDLSHQSWAHLPKEKHPGAVATILAPNTFRGPFAGNTDAAQQYASDADRAIKALTGRGHQLAAFMVDTALCSNGPILAPEGYFNLVAQKVKAAGGFVIADEVQAGCGRMGTFWGFRANGMADELVDFITMGKPVGNAHPLGVIILSRELLNTFLKGNHPTLFSTFGGNTVACAAGMAVLDVLERDNLIAKSREIGNFFRAELQKLAAKHSLIGNVRGRGMMIGVELVKDRASKAPAIEETTRLLEMMKIERILVGTGTPNVLKLRPMLIWQKDEVDFFINALDKCLNQLTSSA